MTLKGLRKERKLTLKQVSEAMKIPISNISKFEAGLTKMRPTTKKRFCEYYGVEDFEELNQKSEYNTLKDQMAILKKVLKYNIRVGETTSKGKIVVLERNIMEISDLEYHVLKRFIEENDLNIFILKGDN